MHRLLGITLTAIITLGLGCSSPTDDGTAAAPPSASTTPPSPAQPADRATQSGAETPEQVAERVMQAVSTVDEDGFKAVLTQKARESMEAEGDGGFGGQEYESWEIGEAVIEDSEASVPVDAVSAGTTENLNLKLRQESGEWRLYAVAIEVAPGSSMTVNFENIGEMMQEMMEGIGEALGDALGSAMESAFQMGSPEEVALKAAMFDAFEGIDTETYETSWKNAEDFRGKPRSDALTALAASMSLTIHAGDHAGALSGAVETDVQGLSNLEAIERIANEAGLYSVLPNLQDWGIASALKELMAGMIGAMIDGENPVISAEGDGADQALDEARRAADDVPETAITFAATKPVQSPQFAGPFRVDLVDLSENAPYATGDLMLSAAAHGLPTPVLSALEQEGESFRIDAVENSNGEPLIDMDLSYLGGGSVVGSAYFDMANRELTGLLRSVDRIARIAGAIDVDLPVTVEEIDFDGLAQGASQEVNGITVTAEQVDSYASFKITGPDDALDSLNVLAQAYGADGSPMAVHYTDYQSWQAGEGTISINANDTPARVRLKLVLASETASYPYEFTDVPLRSAAQQPEALAELDYGDNDAPLKITFGGIVERDPSFSKVTVSIENVSNKDPESVFVDFLYFDADGNELDSFPHTINGEFTADGFEPLAKPGESVDTEQTAFQMPENTDSIGFKLNHVDFMDGTRWEAEQ